MIGLVLSALRSRRAQTLALLVLTVLAAAGGSAAPWFQGWAQQEAAAADIAAAPIQQRIVRVTGAARNVIGAQSPVETFRQKVAEQLSVPGGAATVELNIYATARPTPGSPVEKSLALTYRDDVCAHLSITTGRCPANRGDVIVSGRIAALLGVQPGDPLTFSAVNLAAPITLTVSGLYQVADVLGSYWSGDLEPTTDVQTSLDESAFVTAQTLVDGSSTNALYLKYRLLLPPSAFHDGGTELLATLRRSGDRLRPSTFGVDTTADRLVQQIRRDQYLAGTGIEVAAVQLVLLGWFALYLAVRYTSDARRADIGLLKLRGAAGRRVWALTALQSAVPMAAGAAVGWVLGVLASAGLAGDLTALRPTGSALPQSLVVLGGIILGAFAVAVAAEIQAVRAPIAALIRRVPARPLGWTSQVGELAVVVVALAGVYQGYADLRASGTPSVIALLAPGLLGLAIALPVARALPWFAATAGRTALRGGRASLALTALQVARRPGQQRVFAVVAVCVCLLTTTAMFSQTASQSWARRAVAEVGAARVLTVRAANSTVLLAAVRTADPSGRYAMAVARGSGLNGQDRVLAVDADRLAAVALLPPELGLPDPARLAGLLHPVAPAAPTVADGPLSLDAALDAPGASLTRTVDAPATSAPTAAPVAADPAVRLAVDLVSPDGAWHQVSVGPLGAGRHPYQATVSGCPTGCRLAGLDVVTPRPDVTVDLFELGQAGRAIVTAADFADVSRWRPPTEPDQVGAQLDAGQGRLRLTLYNGHLPDGVHTSGRVLLAAGPSELPALLVGPPIGAARAGETRIRPLGKDSVPYVVVGGGRALPGVANGGALVDLAYAQLTAGGAPELVGLEVWLTGDTPPAVLDRLHTAGVEVVSERTVAAVTARFHSQGPGIALRFELFVAAMALLIAAATVAVSAAVERGPRAAELSALRAQGLSGRAVRVTAYLGATVLSGGAILTGLLAARLGDAVVSTTLPVFNDTWTLLPPPDPDRSAPLVVVAGAAALLLGAATLVGAARVVRSVRLRREQPS